MAFTLDPQTGKITFGVVADLTHDAIARDIAQEFGVSEAFKDNFSTYLNQGEADTAWVPQDTPDNQVNVANDNYAFTVIRDGTNIGTSHDLGAGNVSDTTWVLRAKVVIGSPYVITSTLSAGFQVSLSDTDSSVGAGGLNNDIRISLVNTLIGGGREHVAGDNVGGVGSSTSGSNTVFVAGETVYLEVVRLSSTSMKTTVYTDDTYSVVRDSITRAISASITGLRYIKLGGPTDVTGWDGTFTGTLDDIQFWNGVTTPVITVNDWRLRFTLDITALSLPSGSDLSMWVGLYDEDETSDSTNLQDGFQLGVFVDNTLNRFVVGTPDNQAPRSAGIDKTMTTAPSVSTFFVEMQRDSASQTTVRFYTDNTYTSVSETQTQAGVSGSNNLKYLKIFNDVLGNNANTMDGTIDDITFDGMLAVITEQTSEVNALLQTQNLEEEFIVNALLQAQGDNGACPIGGEAISSVLDNIDDWDTQVNTGSTNFKIGQRWTPTVGEVALLENGITKVNLWHGHTGGSGSFDTFVWSNAGVGTSSETVVRFGGTFNFIGSSSSISKRNRTLFDATGSFVEKWLPTAGVEYVIGIVEDFPGTAQTRKTSTDTINGVFTTRSSAGNWTDTVGQDWTLQFTIEQSGLGQGDQQFCLSADGLLQAQGDNGCLNTNFFDQIAGNSSLWTSNTSQIVIDSGGSGIVEMNALVGGGTTTSRRATRALDTSFSANSGVITIRQKVTKLASTTPTGIFMAIQNGTGDASLVGSSPRLYYAFGTGSPTGLFAHISDGTNFVNTPEPQIEIGDGETQFVETIYDPVAQTLTLNSYSDSSFTTHVTGSPIQVDASIISMPATLIDTVVSSNFTNAGAGRVLSADLDDYQVTTGACPTLEVDAFLQALGENGGCDTVILGVPFGSRSEQTSTFSPGIGGGTSWGEGAGIRFTPSVTMKIRAIEWNSTKGGGFQSGQVRCNVYTGVPTSGNITAGSVTIIPGQQSFNTDDPHGGNEGSLSQFITFWATGSQKRRNEFLNVPASSNTSGVGGFLELDAGTEYVFMLREQDVGTGWTVSSTTGGNSNQSALDVTGVRFEHWNNVVNPSTAEVLDLSPDDFAVDFEIETNKTAGCAEVNALLQSQGVCSESTIVFDQIAGNSGLWTEVDGAGEIEIDLAGSGVLEWNSLRGGGLTVETFAHRTIPNFADNIGKITLRIKVDKISSNIPTGRFIIIQNNNLHPNPSTGSSFQIALSSSDPSGGIFASLTDGTNSVSTTPRPAFPNSTKFLEAIYDPVGQTLTQNIYTDANFSIHDTGSPVQVDASAVSMTGLTFTHMLTSNVKNSGISRVISADLDDFTVITGGCPSISVDAILDQQIQTIDKEFIVNSILIVRKTHDFIVKALLKATFDKEFIVDAIVRYAQGSFVGTYGAIPDLIIRVLRENGTLTGSQIVEEINIITADPAEGFPFVGKTSRIKNWLNRLRLDNLILNDNSNPDWYRTNWSLNPAVFP